MAYDVNKLTKLEALKALAQRVASDYATKNELAPVSQNAAAAFKSGKVEGNSVKLFTSTNAEGAAAFTFDFPVEMVLDQAKTAFVPKFNWSAETYPETNDPKLNGKPVMVLAVKGSDGSVSYSFMDMATLVDTYKAKVDGKDSSTTITIAGYEVDVKVNISAEEGNQIQLKSDGLYVPKPAAVDMSGKADKVDGAVDGNFAGLDASGNLVDSGKKASDFSKVTKSEVNGNVLVDGSEVIVYTEASDVVHGQIATSTEVEDMLTEVFGAKA